MNSAETYSAGPATSIARDHSDPVAAHSALVGMTLGRRERIHGSLRTIAEISITSIIEPVEDLAIADRVAFILAHRTNTTHLVVATSTTYLVVTVDHDIDADDAHAIHQHPDLPRIVSVATTNGIIPIIRAIPTERC